MLTSSQLLAFVLALYLYLEVDYLALTAAATATGPRQPNAFWSALTAFLSHPSHLVRREAAQQLQGLYRSLPAQAGTLAAAALHALWDRVRALEVCAPRISARGGRGSSTSHSSGGVGGTASSLLSPAPPLLCGHTLLCCLCASA